MSLRSDDDYEWLHPSTPPAASGSGAEFTRVGMGGWDEIAPTVQPDIANDGTTLPDHGEVWNVPWTLLSGSETDLTLEVRLTTVPVTLTRTISPTDSGLRLSYTATTPSIDPTPFLWCAHPQFSNADEATLTLEALGSRLSPGLTEVYPAEGRRRGFSGARVHRSLPRGASLKAFLEPTSRADAALLTVRGRTLRMSWSPSQLPYLGLFWDNGEFAQSPVLVVEPSTSWGEKLSSAVRTGHALTVSADAPQEWHLTLAQTVRG